MEKWLLALYYFSNFLLFERDFCMTALRTLQQHGLDSQNSVGRPVSQAGLLQTLHFGSRAQEHNPSTVPEPGPLLSGLLSLYMTLAFENFLFSLRCCCFIWALSFGKRGACISLQGFLMWMRAHMRLRRLSTAHSSSKCVRNCAKRGKFAATL